jgi:hypothetical protein
MACVACEYVDQITSVAVNLTKAAVRTRSGHVYLLGVHDQPELDPELHAHLAYALKTWGFENVRPR